MTTMSGVKGIVYEGISEMSNIPEERLSDNLKVLDVLSTVEQEAGLLELMSLVGLLQFRCGSNISPEIVQCKFQSDERRSLTIRDLVGILESYL